MSGGGEQTGPQLHVVALNETPVGRTTFLSRQGGEDAPDLSDLAEALGLSSLDAARLELFPVSDLGGMRLSDYITEAFAPDDPLPPDIRARLNAIDGSVALLLDDALPEGESLRSGARARRIASVPLERPDHAADLPPADTGRDAAPAPQEEAPPPDSDRRHSLGLFLALFALGVLILVIGGLS